MKVDMMKGVTASYEGIKCSVVGRDDAGKRKTFVLDLPWEAAGEIVWIYYHTPWPDQPLPWDD